MSFTRVGGHRIEYEWTGDGPSDRVIVLLHQGLGSVSAWRDFPAMLAHATRHRVLAYSRLGYGRSAPIVAPRSVEFMHEEALSALPELLDGLGAGAPVLVGHSDGGSIALIHAAAGREVRGVVVIAPHVKVEEITVRSIRAARDAYATTDLREKLERHHDDVESALRSSSDVWLDPAFRSWNIESLLPRIRCPMLAIQGEDDEYGTMEQVDSIARHAADVRLLKLAGAGHSPHRDRPDEVLAAVSQFVVELERRRDAASRRPRTSA